MKKPLMALLAVAVVASAWLISGSDEVATANPDTVNAGHDLFETDGSRTWDIVTTPPFPGGCDPVVNTTVMMKGDPFDSYGSYNGLSPTDTIVERLEAAWPFPDTIDIEIVRLELRSVTPLTVTCPGPDQSWEMTAQVPESDPCNQATGTMTIRHEYANGGTFDSTLPVTPLLTFTRLDGPGVIGPFCGPPIQFEARNIPWCHQASPLDDPAGDVVVEVAGLTSNFFPGIVCPDSPHNGVGTDGQRTKCVTQEQAALAKHGVLPAENPPATQVVSPSCIPLGVGGTTELLVDGSGVPRSASTGSDASAWPYAALAAGGWYARRRFTRRQV